MIAPAESRTVIVALAPAVPVTAAPSGETLATGASGWSPTTRSGAIAIVVGDRLPAASRCVTASRSPSTSGGTSATVKLPGLFGITAMT